MQAALPLPPQLCPPLTIGAAPLLSDIGFYGYPALATNNPKVLRNTFSTRDKSVTRPTENVMEIVDNTDTGIVHLYECPTMVERACRYFDYRDDGSSWRAHGLALALHHRIYRAVDLTGRTLPEHAFQKLVAAAHRIVFLWGLRQRYHPLVNVQAIQDLVRQFIIDVVNDFIDVSSMRNKCAIVHVLN